MSLWTNNSSFVVMTESPFQSTLVPGISSSGSGNVDGGGTPRPFNIPSPSDVLDAAATTASASNDTSPVQFSPTDPPPMLFEFITYGVLMCLVGILGLIGNAISIVILSRPQMRSSVNCLLLGLTTFDMVLIVTSIVIFGIPSIYQYFAPMTGTSSFLHYYYWNVYPHAAPFVYPLALTAQTGSVYLTLTVTLERYVAVCHPLRARRLCTYGRARLYVCAIAVFATLYNLPRFFEVSVQMETIAGTNITVAKAVPTSLRKNHTYVQVYINWVYLVVMYFVPFLSLAIFNAAIYRQVRIANSERQRLSRHQRKEIGLATMLLCVVVVFFLCNVLALVNNVLESLAGIFIDQVVQASNLLVTVNSSVNFVIYCIFGDKFKRLFLRLFCPAAAAARWRCCRPSSGTASTASGLHSTIVGGHNGNAGSSLISRHHNRYRSTMLHHDNCSGNNTDVIVDCNGGTIAKKTIAESEDGSYKKPPFVGSRRRHWRYYWQSGCRRHRRESPPTDSSAGMLEHHLLPSPRNGGMAPSPLLLLKTPVEITATLTYSNGGDMTTSCKADRTVTQL